MESLWVFVAPLILGFSCDCLVWAAGPAAGGSAVCGMGPDGIGSDGDLMECQQIALSTLKI
ncbi:unnamed protein product [Ectocarpus sp. CCAP 1310/34]|nr:unnamed protein product [Ectocarpus sp. CCAP 1310/34]